MTSLFNRFWYLLRTAEAVTREGWPPAGDALPPRLLREEGEDDGLPALLRDYGCGGSGSLSPKLVILTGHEITEEERGFVGKWTGAIHLDWEKDIYTLAGPNDPDALKTLSEILDYLQPKSLLVLGENAARVLLSRNLSLELFRDQVLQFSRWPLVVTHHPRQVLENTDLKRPVWKDLQRLDGVLRYA